MFSSPGLDPWERWVTAVSPTPEQELHSPPLPVMSEESLNAQLSFTPSHGTLHLRHGPSCLPHPVLVTCDMGELTGGAKPSVGEIHPHHLPVGLGDTFAFTVRRERDGSREHHLASTSAGTAGGRHSWMQHTGMGARTRLQRRKSCMCGRALAVGRN